MTTPPHPHHPNSPSSPVKEDTKFGSWESDEPPLKDALVKGLLNSFVLLFSFGAFILFLLGGYDTLFLRNVEEENNQCEMTSTFYRDPEYVRIKPGKVGMDKKYGLYAYAEGNGNSLLLKEVEMWKLKFTGIPVLFVPGSGGSYKQVQSFASLALRRSLDLDSRTAFHFDFFTIDFNEELSCLYGYVLSDQSEYLARAVETIQSFYDVKHSVILICHSTGGIVAKALRGKEALSNMIITIATPHSRPVMIFDQRQDLFYYRLSRNWTRAGESLKKEVTLISVGGGDRDFIVPESFTSWGKHLSLLTTTTEIPGVWASVDHQSILSCKQFILTVLRMLSDMVEFHKEPNGYYALTQNMELRDKILKYHLNKKSSDYGDSNDLELGRPPGSTWIESLERKYFTPSSSSSTTYLMFPKVLIKQQMRGDPEDYRVLILTTNTEAKNWVFGCTSESITNAVRHCSQADNLSPLGEIRPDFRGRRERLIHLKYSDVVNYTHLVVKMEPLNTKACVNLEVYDDTDRSKPLNGKFETENKIFYNLSLPLASQIFVWNIIAHAENGTCKDESASFHHGSFKIQTSSANVQLYLEPSCKYTIQVRLASLETAGQIFRTYVRYLPSFMGSIVLMSLYFQRDGTNWSNFHRVLIANAYHLTILPGFVVSILLSILPNDWPHMMDGPEYFIILPMFCYLAAFAIVALTASGTWYFVIASGNAVHAVFLKLSTTRFANWSTLRIPIPNVADMEFDFTFGKFPAIISILLVSLSLKTGGGFGFLVTSCFSVLKLVKMYEDLLGDVGRARIQDVSDGLSPLNFQFHCCMIWFFLTGMNFPSLIHWVKSLPYTKEPQWDLTMYLCLMNVPSIAILMQNNVPNFNPMLWRLHRFFSYATGLTTVIFGTFRLYFTSLTLTFILILTAACQLISSIPFPKDEDVEGQTAPGNVNGHDSAPYNFADRYDPSDPSSSSGDEELDELDREEKQLTKESYRRARMEERELFGGDILSYNRVKRGRMESENEEDDATFLLKIEL